MLLAEFVLPLDSCGPPGPLSQEQEQEQGRSRGSWTSTALVVAL